MFIAQFQWHNLLTASVFTIFGSLARARRLFDVCRMGGMQVSEVNTLRDRFAINLEFIIMLHLIIMLKELCVY